MISFYSNEMSRSVANLMLFFQMTPVLIVYMGILKYFFPKKFLWPSILLIAAPTYGLGWAYNITVQRYFQEVFIVDNVFVVVSQATMVLILYAVYNRGERIFFTNFMMVNFLLVLAAGLYEYILVFLLNNFTSSLVSVHIVNWYFLFYLLLIPFIKLILKNTQAFIQAYPNSSLILLWILVVTLSLFFIFVQASSVSKSSLNPNYSSTIFLADGYVGTAFIKWLAPSALYIIEPIYQVFTWGTATVLTSAAALGAFVFLIFLNQRTKKKLEQQEQLKYELTQYVSSLESVTQNIRKNHHDFNNLLFSLGGYIYQTPINEKELKNYFESVSQTFEKDYHYFLEISKLKNLIIPELKTLIFTKLLTATKKNISFDIEVEQLVEHLPIDPLILTRICGILIDNALEAAESCEEPYVRLAIIEDDLQYLFILVNSKNTKNVSPVLLQQDNFSTKGEHRGLGLSIVHSLIQNYSKKITLRTTQTEKEFSQSLIIKKGVF